VEIYADSYLADRIKRKLGTREKNHLYGIIFIIYINFISSIRLLYQL